MIAIVLSRNRKILRRLIRIMSTFIFSNSNGMRIIKFRSRISIYLPTYLPINPSNVYFHSSSRFYYIDELVLWYSGHWEPVLQFYFYPGSKVFITVNLTAFFHLPDEFHQDQTNLWAQFLFENFRISKYVSIKHFSLFPNNNIKTQIK